MSHLLRGAPNNVQITPVNKAVHGSIIQFNARSIVPNEVIFTWTPWDYDGDKFLCLVNTTLNKVFYPSTPEPELMSTGAYIIPGLVTGQRYLFHGFAYSVDTNSFSQSRWKFVTVI
jgi:hypothetical protein